MKKSILLYLISLSPTLSILAQYSLAPEVWSIPEKIAVISEWAVRAESPSISFDGQKLYIDAGGIAVTEWSDTGWTIPYGLNSNINQNLANYPCISPNGKRIYFTWYLGGWDLYYSDWDSTINDWGLAVNCGPGVNEPEWAEWQCTLPNDTTLIFQKTSDTNISYWDKETQTWGPAERWPTPTLWFTSDWGIYVSPNMEKVYTMRSRADTTKTGEWYLNYDIGVAYKDTTNPMGYKPAKFLNFCFYADTQYFAGNYEDRFEGFPTLTADGKKMYFTATYDGKTTIYESTLLIDENGDPVSVDDDYEHGLIPEKIELYPAYPNPFNPQTRIGFWIPEQTNLTLSVYDILGQKVTTLINGERTAGEHYIYFSAVDYNLSSGIYTIVLEALGTFLSRKVLLIK